MKISCIQVSEDDDNSTGPFNTGVINQISTKAVE